MKHHLVVIGWLSVKRCYLDISRDEAIRRYCVGKETTSEQLVKDNVDIDEFDFDDEFGAYDVWSLT